MSQSEKKWMKNNYLFHKLIILMEFYFANSSFLMEREKVKEKDFESPTILMKDQESTILMEDQERRKWKEAYVIFNDILIIKLK